MSPLNEWPNFSVTVRCSIHRSPRCPCGHRSGRAALPLPPTDLSGPDDLERGWMAAIRRFLDRAESIAGKTDIDTQGGEREAVTKLLDDEITQSGDGGSRRELISSLAPCQIVCLTIACGTEVASCVSEPEPTPPVQMGKDGPHLLQRHRQSALNPPGADLSHRERHGTDPRVWSR